MCTGALIQSRIDRVVYGARDEKSGSIDSQIQFRKIPRIQHQPHIQEGVLVIECKALLTDYFSKKRHEKN
jgi:tRNA(adenine34) deaminase